jgi:hypothetical protein
MEAVCETREEKGERRPQESEFPPGDVKRLSRILSPYLLLSYLLSPALCFVAHPMMSDKALVKEVHA